MVPCKKSIIVSSTSSRMKNIVIFPAYTRFPVKLIYCISLLPLNGKTKNLFSLKTFDWYLFQLIVCLNPDFNRWCSFVLS